MKKLILLLTTICVLTSCIKESQGIITNTNKRIKIVEKTSVYQIVTVDDTLFYLTNYHGGLIQIK